MSFPGAILMGAQRRLLPMSVPYRFFISAAAFHLLAWVLLAFAADDVAGYQGGPGPVLAVLHALTLGVLVMTAMGASFQMLPVATGRALMAIWPARLASWLYLPGVAVLLFGFHTGMVAAMAAGGALVALGLGVFLVLVGDVFRRTTEVLFVLRAFGWAALVSLLGLVSLGLLAIGDMGIGLLDDRAAIGLAHMILAAFGFMGLLSMGYSYILVPMFALSPAPSEQEGTAAFTLGAIGLALAVLGVLFGHAVAMVMGAGLGLAAAAVFVRTMLTSIQTGMRKNLGLSFVLVKASWALLPMALLAGLVAATGIFDERAAAVFVFLALFGWLLTLLLGILQRIIPFLASMNAGKGTRLSDLANEKPLKYHAICHFSAIVLVLAGIVTEMAPVILIGALAGTAGALVFLWFALDVVRRLVATRKTTQETENKDNVSAEAAHSPDPS